MSGQVPPTSRMNSIDYKKLSMSILELNMVQRACQSWRYIDDDNNSWNPPGKSNDIWQRYSDFMDDCHAFYLLQKIMRTIIGSVDATHIKYEADCWIGSP